MHADRLVELCRSAKDQVVLVAPFIKLAALERLLDALSPDVPLDCVTRWWPQELASGVSDLEIWQLFYKSEGSRRLFLRQDLHAKYYRADGRCLLGSANLTGRALGYVQPANFELLVDLPAATHELVEFEHALWRGTVQVDDNAYRAMRELVMSLPPQPESAPIVDGTPDGPIALLDVTTWIPRTRHPEDLYLAYRGDAELLTHAAAASAAADLAILNIPSGLSRAQFDLAVRTLLLQTPVAWAVDRFLATERRFGEVTQLLGEIAGTSQPGMDWQALLRWFLHFAPDRYCYRRPRHTELIGRRK